MKIKKYKLKLSVISLLIIQSSLSFSHHTGYNNVVIKEIKAIDNIPFRLNKYSIDFLNENPNIFYEYGKLRERYDLPTILTSKNSTVRIISSEYNYEQTHIISYDNGQSFEALTIDGFDNLNFYSLSENGRYAVVLGNDIINNKNNKFFIYDTHLKAITPFIMSNDKIIFNRYDYFFTTQDGRYTLQNDYDDTYKELSLKHDNYIPYNKMRYSIYDHKEKKLIPYNKFEKTEINEHPEKNRFHAFRQLDFIETYLDKKPKITSTTLDGKYIYGEMLKGITIPNYIFQHIAFIYNTETKKLKKIGPISDDKGESEINAVSNNNIFVGWYESFDKKEKVSLTDPNLGIDPLRKTKIIIRQAFFYDPSAQDKIIDLPSIHPNSNNSWFKTNSEARDITDDGHYIVGWTETASRRGRGDTRDSNSNYLRNAFIYNRNKDSNLTLLKNLPFGNESEALSISGDGSVVYGIANDRANKWKLVSWQIKKNNIVDNPDNGFDNKIDINAQEKQRIADEAKAKAEQQAQHDADEKAKADTKEKDQESTSSSIAISKPIDIENTYKSMQLMAENGYKLIDMQQGQLRYLASATCSVETEKACISGFTHYQNINKANATQTGLSGAYRFDINHIPLVIGLAIDTDVYSSLPKGYQYQGYALPLIGFSLDLIPSLNKTLNNNALHLSLKGAYLNRKVSIERQLLDDTEAGKGNAKVSGYHIDLQGYYPYSVNGRMTLTPFAGITFSQTSRSAYSETQGALFAAHYASLKAHSLLGKMGLGLDYALNTSLIFNTKAGLLWTLSHHQGDFQSHIDYLGQQRIDYSENKAQLKQRPFASIGVTYQIDKRAAINTTANWQMSTYRHHDTQLGISYTYRF